MCQQRFQVSERVACRVLDQPRSVQRYAPMLRSDEDALTRDIVSLAGQYGRYGYRRITALLVDQGWRVGKDYCLFGGRTATRVHMRHRSTRLWLPYE